jgi:hypothetical protein
VAAYFENLLILQRSLMGYNIVSKCDKDSKSFSYKDSLFILSTIRKEDFKINSSFRSDILVYLGFLEGDKSDSSIFRMVILGFIIVFYYFLLSLWVIIIY